MVCDLTGMALSNASLLDESTAAAEAMSMTYSLSNLKRKKFFVDSRCHPQTIALTHTRGKALGMEVIVGDASKVELDASFCGAMVQYPDTYGGLTDWSEFVHKAHAHEVLTVACTDLLASVLVKPVGEVGFDIAVGSAQRFGVPMGFGGPHAAFLATTQAYSRKMPGRIIGVSIDSRGKPALRMAMQTREQHIRRDKATSNICTAQALLANMAAMYAVYHGPCGLMSIASRVHNMTVAVAGALTKAGYKLDSAPFFDTLRVDVSAKGKTAEQVAKACSAAGINVRIISPTHIGISLGEAVTKKDCEALVSAFGASPAALSSPAAGIPDKFKRTSAFLTHPVFNTHHSETQMLRYLKSLENKDLSLNFSMISLGSCTMKLNATTEMIPVTWPETCNMHPFAPEDQARGYEEMISSLNKDLAEITGFAAVSAQPNSGAQGEYAGLLCIKAYHESRGDAHRNICLIPVSAHGTNPASAAMCGMKVVVVKSDEKGNVDLADLKVRFPSLYLSLSVSSLPARTCPCSLPSHSFSHLLFSSPLLCPTNQAKAAAAGKNLAALMITYPSTYGVFEEEVKNIIDCVHSHGGQVYMDGANMNAQVALTSPGAIGADVCHLNLHKTFCIPHGGGGPGVGSIGVAKHLAPFLPGHPVVPCGGEGANTKKKSDMTVSAAPFGSAAILPISWLYIKMLGEPGLKEATGMAILNANYMAARIEEGYSILYRCVTAPLPCPCSCSHICLPHSHVFTTYPPSFILSLFSLAPPTTAAARDSAHTSSSWTCAPSSSTASSRRTWPSASRTTASTPLPCPGPCPARS